MRKSVRLLSASAMLASLTIFSACGSKAATPTQPTTQPPTTTQQARSVAAPGLSSPTNGAQLTETAVILKATNVDGIYTGDPRTDPAATFIPELTFQEAIVKNYAVMDANAFGLCKANQLPIIVFNINQPGAITRVLQGERVGTIVR